MEYVALKHMHMGFAGLSGLLFLVRGVWMLRASPMLQQRWVRIAPHIIDTLLLTTAIVLAVWSSQYPFVQAWLTAKVVALVIYIGLGTVALKRGRSPGVRAAAFAGALLTFLYIVSVAVSKQPVPFV
ncbi:MAG: SirB2 family protein [Gammaproteobacteria bacterium]